MEIGQFFARLLGVAGLVLGSQGPGFTGQYMQNLSGRVAELAAIVEKYDAIVQDLDISRDGYVEDLRAAGRESTDKTADVVEDTYARYESLKAHLDTLEATDAFRRPLMLVRDYKRDIVESAMSKFEWSVPLTPEAAVYALGGGTTLWGGPAALFSLIGGFFGMGGRRYA